MTPQQRAEFERVDALLRKAFGRVNYDDKPQTQYPPRVYMFMHAEL